MKTTAQVKRSQRLRKKLYVDEYAVLGFEVSFQFVELDEMAFDTFFSDIIGFVESRDLIMGGATTFSVFISSFARYSSTTEEDRSVFQAWLAEHPFIKKAVVGELVDAYYGN